MITLLTGVPGSGKTAAAVDLLCREFKDRVLYVDGLNGLTLEHVELDVLQWHLEVPDGAVIIVDEVQRKWRPRGPGGKVPDSVAALETHRHRGIDFIIITQNPRLVDSNVRDLVGRHIHIRDTGWMGRWWYEWPECSASVAWKACQNKRRYKLPSHVFKLYKSASIHTKPVRKAPLLLWLIAAALVALCVAAYVLKGSVSKTLEPTKLPALEHSKDVSGAGISVSGGLPGQEPKVFDFGEFIPRQSNRPESAPAYDELRKVIVMPVVVGGLCKGGQCTCYTQQGTHAGLSSQECSDWMHQRPFDPYTVPLPPQPMQPPVQQVKQEEGPQSVPMPDAPVRQAGEVTIHEVTRAAKAGRLAELGTL